MNILVVTLTYNEAAILPFFLRHYERFADRIVVYDSGSTDGTLDILRAHALVDLRHRPPTHGVIDDEENIIYKTRGWKDGFGDWIITVDTDELLWDTDLRGRLEWCETRDFNCAMGEAWDMIGDEIPTGGQIYDHIKEGVRRPDFDKMILFKPGTDMKHGPGCHAYTGFKLRPADVDWKVKLLHYKWLSLGHVQRKADNLKLSERNIRGRLGYHDGVPANEMWVKLYQAWRVERKRLDFLP